MSDKKTMCVLISWMYRDGDSEYVEQHTDIRDKAVIDDAYKLAYGHEQWHKENYDEHEDWTWWDGTRVAILIDMEEISDEVRRMFDKYNK